MRKGIVACAGMIVGLVLLVVAFLGPWYMINATGMLGADYTMELFLTRMEVKGNLGVRMFHCPWGTRRQKRTCKAPM